MRKYRVALVTDYYLPKIGGVEHHMHDLARELKARGHEPDVICITQGDQILSGIPEYRLQVPLWPFVRRASALPAVKELEAMFRKERYDIIHAHGLSTLGPAANYVARKLGIPSLLTVHTVLRGREPWLSALDRIVPWAQWPTLLTAVSSYVAKQLQRVARREVLVLHNAVNPDHWLMESQEPRERRVTSVGRFDANKCQGDIIRAIPAILAQLPPDLHPRFTLIGDGPTHAQVARLVKRLGVEQHVELLGFQTRPEIRKILNRSNVFIQPSIREALPIAVLEARSAALPIVAREKNGVSDMVEHGRQGFLFKNVHELSHYVARLLRDEPLRQQMSGHARAGLDWFSWEQTIARTVGLYDLATERVRAGVQVVVPDDIGLPGSAPATTKHAHRRVRTR